MSGTLADLLDVASRNVGFIEGPDNENPYAEVAGHVPNQPWCASFVVACFKRAGVELFGHSAYTPTFANAFKTAGAWGHEGKPGDVVFFEWPSMGRIAHVGIVEKRNEDGSYVCIEGNTDVAGGRTGGRVMRQLRRANIAGFGRPVYAAAPAKKAVPKKASTNVPAGASPTLGLQNPPLYGPKVADVHRYLISLDPKNRERLGDDVAAKRYGRHTSVLVERFKKPRKISEPGWGPKCWAEARKKR